jgi:DNA-directed RNA polymerase subunit RPC12/RpoP
MALIACPECKAQVSDKAAVCVKCGHPIAAERGAASQSSSTTLSVGPCPKCGSRDTYDHVAEQQRASGGGWSASLGAKWGAKARLAAEGKGRYFCNKCGYNWHMA